ncbi:MAG: hypothetical protein ABSG85_13535 [Spirochaetia bacterium]|jgi:hypothetical protein
MRRTPRYLRPGLPILGVLLAASCGPLPDSRTQDTDLLPPQVQSVQALGPGEISISFDEDAGLCADKTRITPPLAVTDVTGPSKNVLLRGEEQAPGRPYVLEAEARDAHGNSASFVAQFYGFNARVPRLLINEFTPRGSGNHPDLVELKVLSAGNMGGVVLCLGSPGSYDARMVFPPFEVGAGSYIVVHLKPSGEAGEVDETTDTAASKGFDASDTAFDFWLRDGRGLGGNNGVLSLCDRPGGTCMDGVLYSNRTIQSDEQNGGFGSDEMRARAEELVRCGAWKPAGGRVTPEDGVSPEGSTGTRSICRSSASIDTDRPEDWHIVPTRKASFGADNTDEVYAP